MYNVRAVNKKWAASWTPATEFSTGPRPSCLAAAVCKNMTLYTSIVGLVSSGRCHRVHVTVSWCPEFARKLATMRPIGIWVPLNLCRGFALLTVEHMLVRKLPRTNQVLHMQQHRICAVRDHYCCSTSRITVA